MTEFIMLTIVRPGYIFSFFFWMDLLSTISTAMDIPQVVNLLMLSFLSAQSSFVKYCDKNKLGLVGPRKYQQEQPRLSE